MASDSRPLSNECFDLSQELEAQRLRRFEFAGMLVFVDVAILIRLVVLKPKDASGHVRWVNRVGWPWRKAMSHRTADGFSSEAKRKSYKLPRPGR
jgi:hypothetical protein